MKALNNIMKVQNIDNEMEGNRLKTKSINYKNERNTTDHDSRGNRYTGGIESDKTDEDVLDGLEKEVQLVR